MSYKDIQNSENRRATSGVRGFGSENFNLRQLYPDVGDCSTLIVRTRPDNYSASILARAVEDCDAHLLNLNVGARSDDGEHLVIYLRVNHRSGESVGRSLERFGYQVELIDDGETSGADSESARERVNELMRYLEI